jgi:gluconokinase
MMERKLILAIDIGSSSVRAGIYDLNAQPLPSMSVKIDRDFNASLDGGAELDADGAFSQVVATIDSLLKRSEKLLGEIRGVAPCAFLHSLVGVDARGKPTTKVFGWADTRSREYTGVLKKRFDEDTIHNRTGAHFHSSFWPAKLLWLRKEFPTVFAKTTKWLSFSDFVALKLFCDPVTSVSMASPTGIFDIRDCTWDAQLLTFLKIKPNTLPTVHNSGTSTFKLNKAFAKRWPRLKDAKWFPAIGDGMADNIGAGCTTKNRAALMIGSSGAMRVAYTGEPPKQIPRGLWCYRIDHKRVILGGALSDGGNLIQRLKSNLKLPKDAESQIAKRKPGAHGITFLPFLHGERSTGYDEGASGAIIGVNASHDAVDLLQAAMESVAYRFTEIFDRLKRVAKIDEIVASGGALRDSPVWTQIIADVLGREVKMNAADESSMRGTVIFALDKVGTIIDSNISRGAHRQTIKCDRDRFALYQMARKRHEDFYKRLNNSKNHDSRNPNEKRT